MSARPSYLPEEAIRRASRVLALDRATRHQVRAGHQTEARVRDRDRISVGQDRFQAAVVRQVRGRHVLLQRTRNPGVSVAIRQLALRRVRSPSGDHLPLRRLPRPGARLRGGEQLERSARVAMASSGRTERAGDARSSEATVRDRSVAAQPQRDSDGPESHRMLRQSARRDRTVRI